MVAALLAGTAASAVSLGVAGCAGDDDRRAVRSAIVELRRAVAAGDWARACRMLTPAARRQAGIAVHGSVDGCETDLPELLEPILDRGALQRRAEVRLTAAATDDARATARVAVDSWAAAVPLAADGGRWRVDSFFGTAPDAARAAIARTRSAAFPQPGGSPVTASDATGHPCFDVYTADYPRITGGCQITARGTDMALTVLTPLGALSFATCRVHYGAWVDGEGRTWTDTFSVSSDEPDGCSDVRPCRDDSGRQVPWKGTIAAIPGRGYLHRVRACLDTCIGFYAGELDLRFIPGTDAGRLVARAADVGSSGFRLDGTLEAQAGLTLAPRDARS